MLDRYYTIPVIIGLCLGIIMAGVQVSASALGSAIGDFSVLRLVDVEKEGGGNEIVVLGRRISVDPPPAGEREGFACSAAEKAAGFYSHLHEATLKWSAFIFHSGREAVERLLKPQVKSDP